jgi:rare lipoprotein A
LRLDTLRARIVPGALMTMITLAAVPAVASSDTQSQTTTTAAPVATKAASSLAVQSVRRDVLAGRRVVVRGVLSPATAGRAVALQIAGPHGGWTTVDHDRTDGRGRYVLVWRATRTGTKRVRVDFGGTRELSSARRAIGRARVYRRAFASWYGPGFYGQKLACGGRLAAGTLGVAHKTLPCGTKVTLHYRGRTVRVPVIDRGPYVAGRDFDLTAATKAKLGFGSTGTVMSTR